jgi:hypothetical protein
MKLNDECLGIEYSGELIRLTGENFSFEFRQRVIILKNADNVKVYSIRGGSKKVIYAKYYGKLLSCSDLGELVRDEVSTSLFTARVTKCTLGIYLTVVFSGMFLIDYVIISKDLVGLLVPGKREVYVEVSNDIITIYLV